MFFILLSLVFVSLIAGLIGGLILMLATRIVFKEAAPFSVAFNIAFLSMIASCVIQFVLGTVLGIGGTPGWLLGLAGGFGAMTYVTDQQLGIGMKKAAIVSVVVNLIYLAVLMVFALTVFSAAQTIPQGVR